MKEEKRDIIKYVFRVIMIIISLILLIWFMLPIFVYRILNAFNGIGIAASLYILIFYAARGKFRKLKESFYEKAVLRFIWRLGRFFIYSFGIYGFVISVVMLIFAGIAPEQNASAIILGAQVKGTQPTLSLYDRIEAGRSYLEENPEAICVATGGLGDTAQITEAQCIYNVLTSEGIASDRIYLDNEAKNTKENIRNSYEIIKKNGNEASIAIVSDSFHQARARLIARKLGISGSIGAVNANTNLIYLPTFWIREWFGLPYDAIFR